MNWRSLKSYFIVNRVQIRQLIFGDLYNSDDAVLDKYAIHLYMYKYIPTCSSQEEYKSRLLTI